MRKRGSLDPGLCSSFLCCASKWIHVSFIDWWIYLEMVRPTVDDIQGHLSYKETTCVWLFQKLNLHNLLWFLKMLPVLCWPVCVCMWLYIKQYKKIKKESRKVEQRYRILQEREAEMRKSDRKRENIMACSIRKQKFKQ